MAPSFCDDHRRPCGPHIVSQMEACSLCCRVSCAEALLAGCRFYSGFIGIFRFALNKPAL
jgi:hypothetical protein